MASYEFRCGTCQKVFTVSLLISERAGAKPTCPACGTGTVEPVFSPFFTVTSKKS
ncbi:MAG: zinc ribbon domain-containing protein [Deltaproteobacteria bacterium]|nr:zinc ribbon domain-containing protein [Deltaproteobacteria bacterium]MBI3078440.1 zinc ribbon domain-containing protein [Deltaproteobacteria bacterium]